MLQHTVGEEAFFNALKVFYARCRTEAEPVSLDAFEKVVEEVSGRDLTPFFDQWMRRVVVPDYVFERVEVRKEKEGFVTVVGVRNRGTGRMPVSVALETAGGTTTKEVTPDEGKEASITFTSQEEPKALEIDPQKWVLQSRIDNDRQEFGAPEAKIPPEQLAAVGKVDSTRTDEQAIHELVAFYQRPDLDVPTSASLWDFEGMVRYFGMPPEQKERTEARHRENKRAPGQLPRGVKGEKVAVVIGERAGQVVAEVSVTGTLENGGKEIPGRASYLLSKTDDGRWRFINFSSDSW
jgi:hypothetical protein